MDEDRMSTGMTSTQIQPFKDKGPVYLVENLDVGLTSRYFISREQADEYIKGCINCRISLYVYDTFFDDFKPLK